MQWTWDSRRDLAIKGSGDDFRRGMVEAYKAMTEHMPDNGMQCVMFTHQDTGVWSDMVSIFWASGLQVVGAWYIATETTSELKKGGYRAGHRDPDAAQAPGRGSPRLQTAHPPRGQAGGGRPDQADDAPEHRDRGEDGRPGLQRLGPANGRLRGGAQGADRLHQHRRRGRDRLCPAPAAQGRDHGGGRDRRAGGRDRQQPAGPRGARPRDLGGHRRHPALLSAHAGHGDHRGLEARQLPELRQGLPGRRTTPR